jgi:hypothetical protein
MIRQTCAHVAPKLQVKGAFIAAAQANWVQIMLVSEPQFTSDLA